MTIALAPGFTTLPNAASATERLREQAVELEGIFLNTLVSEMFKSLETDSDNGFGGGYAEETWRGMMAEQYSSEMARAGGIGIADQMVAHLIEAQAAATSTADLNAIGAYSR